MEKEFKKEKVNIKEEKLKPLSPTLRDKKRYILVNFEVEKNYSLSFKEINKIVNFYLIEFLGILDYGKAGIWLLQDKFNEKDNTFVLKVNVKYKDKVKGILSLINGFEINYLDDFIKMNENLKDEIDKIKSNLIKLRIKFNVLRVSGTLKSLFKK
jgi:RNase P/RNase MRP subunit POP5